MSSTSKLVINPKDKNLHIYITTPNTLTTDGILAPVLATEESLQHYAGRAKSTKKKDILKYLDSTFPGRSRSISVLKEAIPDTAASKFIEFKNTHQHVILPPLATLQKLGYVDEVRLSKKPNYPVVKDIDYTEKLNWSKNPTNLLFKDITHYQLVLTKSKIPPNIIEIDIPKPKSNISTEHLDISTERFFINDKELENKVLALPRIRRHELAKICQPGDIVLAYPGKFKATANKLFYFLTSKGQGMAFSSLKMVGCENDVIGYGLKGDASLAKISLNSLPTRYKGILILRSKKMTPEKAKLIYAWVKDKFKKKVPYDFIGIGLSIIRRLFKVMGKTLETDQIDKNIRKLYCSVIISLAYKRYGVPTGITSVGDFDVFPKDFFYSKEFIKVGAYFAKGEVQSANESLNIDIESKMSNISLDDISSMIDVSENSELPISEVSKIILQNYIEKTLRHKDLVKRCGIELIPYLNKYNVDKDVFLKNLEEHDEDKFENNIAPIYAVATQYLYDNNTNTLFEPKDGVLDEFNKVIWPKHYAKNEHHVGEHFGTSGFRTIYKYTIVDDNHSLAIAEMIADWMAMGLEMNNSANAWWKKCLAERKYHFQENDTNLIEELLKVESDIVSKITNNSTQLDDKITDVDPMDAIMMKPIESNESLNIRSSIDTFCDSEIKTNIAKVAKKYYQNIESHGWGHVIDVLTKATAMIKLDNTHQDTLTIAEFAAICFHDAGLKKYGRDKHEIYSAKIAAQELKKLKFNTEDINLISCAIKEHRASYKGKFTSSISDLVSSADRNAPNLNEMLFRSYSYHIENGKSHEDAITEAFKHIPDKYGKNGYARFPDYYMLRYKQDLAKLQNKLQTITRAEVASIINNLLSNNTKVSSESLSYYVDVIFDILTSGFKAFSKLQNTYRRYADLNRNDKNFIGENEDTVSKNTKGWLNCKWFEKFGYNSKYGNVPDTRLSKSEFDSKFTKFGYDDFSKIDTTTEKPLVALGFSKCTDIRSAIQAWMRLYFYRITMLKEWMSKIKQQSKTWSEEEQINTKRNLQTVIGALVDLKSFMNKVSKEIDRYYKSFRKGKTISNESYITIKEIIEETRKPLSVTPGEVTISMESSSSLPPTINKDVQKILDDLKTFTYGLYIKGKGVVTDSKKFHDFNPKDFLVQSPDSFEKNRCGMCHDATVYLHDRLTKLRVSFKCVYVESYTKPDLHTHSFVVVELAKGKWGIIDVFSYKSCLNPKIFSSWEKAVDDRKVTWREEEHIETSKYNVFIINSVPPHESNIDVFMKHMRKTGTKHRITYSTESLTPSMEASNIPAKKKQILDYICKHCDIMDPSKLNSERYRKLINGMTDKQFDTFMKDMRDGRFQLHIVAPNMKINLKLDNMVACADSLKLKLFHKIWMRDKATNKKFLSDNEYLVVQLPVRRQEQFIDKKMSVPDNDRSIDGLTGQVSWESKSASITNPEIQILAARNMDASLYELVNVRGGNISSYAELKRSLEENGEARLNDLDPTSRTRVAVMAGVLLTAMLIDNNL